MPPARITVVEHVYYQDGEGQPIAISNGWSRTLTSIDSQPYSRHLKVTEDWTPLDLGWLKDSPISLIILSNEEGKNLERNPTLAEREAISKRIVEVAYTGSHDLGRIEPDSYFLPGESVRLHPLTSSTIHLRCSSGTAKVNLTIFPG